MNPIRPTQSVRTLSESSTLAETPSAPTSPDVAAAPTSYFATRRVSSPTEQSFFGAIAEKVRGRSRSRSRSRIRRDRSRSPLPPTQIDATDSASTLVANGYVHEQSAATRQQQRQASGSNQPGLSQRQTSFGSRTESERYYYGRHSNDWLFGGISVTATVKGLVSKKEPGS
ncbi:hypothetical protein W97_03784 [Coniosporium apollinis CBS 100218]|uniref:Uncharacterized protein n=1 Tax=Coniosporium apollinis (strain CBS 100218) TaxID=1168221 RepID=R7YSC8_CONA1|nr:uncharacterized protein W97_03784 [Coniosporium apollinis CBS 100218]EON64551.1 hypothetical protein W97_03784 [Coniosporium apollinis CBS 100218]